jgi:hypothetical protein
VDVESIPKKSMALHLYPDELTGVDIVGEDMDYTTRLQSWFGKRVLRGTALMFCPNPEVDRRLSECYEPFLRRIFDVIRPKRAVEIGTLYGATTALLAHYSDEVITVDVNYQQMASYISHYFGVDEKITAMIVANDEEKKEYLGGFDFDFAFIDAEHTYDGVAIDFECVKKCGKVLFHDYGLENHPGVTKFIDELPKDEVFIYKPFAFWEAGSGNHDNILH